MRVSLHSTWHLSLWLGLAASSCRFDAPLPPEASTVEPAAASSNEGGTATGEGSDEVLDAVRETMDESTIALDLVEEVALATDTPELAPTPLPDLHDTREISPLVGRWWVDVGANRALLFDISDGALRVAAPGREETELANTLFETVDAGSTHFRLRAAWDGDLSPFEVALVSDVEAVAWREGNPALYRARRLRDLPENLITTLTYTDTSGAESSFTFGDGRLLVETTEGPRELRVYAFATGTGRLDLALVDETGDPGRLMSLLPIEEGAWLAWEEGGTSRGALYTPGRRPSWASSSELERPLEPGPSASAPSPTSPHSGTH